VNILTDGTFSNNGISFSGSSNNNMTSTNISTSGSSTSNRGISLESTSNSNTLEFPFQAPTPPPSLARLFLQAERLAIVEFSFYQVLTIT